MIPVDQLLYDVDLKLNKVATNDHQSIPLEDKIIALNDAQVQLIKSKLNTNNVYKLGLDSFKKRYDDLQSLVVPEGDIPLTDAKTKTNKFIGKLTHLNPTYMFYVDGFILANRGSCTNRVIHLKLAKHADLFTLLNNTNTSPSFEYQETLMTLSDNNVEIYTDGTFTPTSIKVTYIRYPQKIDASGYVKFDDTDSVDQDCELPEYLKDELVDLAVKDLAMSIENFNAVSSAQDRINTNE